MTRQATFRSELCSMAQERRGAAAVEFAIIAPVLALLLLGAFDTAHTLYMRGVLQGVVQKTARDSALESATSSDPVAAAALQDTIDDKVRAQVHALASNAAITITRRYYRTFSDAAAAQAEKYTDTNKDGTCDAGEPYEDANHNLRWDADGADDGQGGAKDRTLYTVAVSYPRLFPLNGLIGGSNVTRLTAQTVLQNQPYTDQGSYSSTLIPQNCP